MVNHVPQIRPSANFFSSLLDDRKSGASEILKATHNIHRFCALREPVQCSYAQGCHKNIPVNEADPENIFAIVKSHRNRDMLPKSTSSCRAARILRPHRLAKYQEILCDSFEEHQVALNIAALPYILAIKEQAVTIPFINAEGKGTRQRIDLVCWRKNGRVFAVSAKYAAQARRQSCLAKINAINQFPNMGQIDKPVVLSCQSFHPHRNVKVKLIHSIRRVWDPEGDRTTLEAANEHKGVSRICDLFSRTRIDEGRTLRSLI